MKGGVGVRYGVGCCVGSEMGLVRAGAIACVVEG